MGSTSTFSSSLEAFLTGHQIQYHTKGSSDYEKHRSAFIVASGYPFAITRPKTATEVALLVQYLGSNKIPFTVRSGGHDTYGRTTLHDGVTIDMRELDHVSVSPDKKTAAVGGGIQSRKLLERLAEHGLHATTGTVSSVGWVGWATMGGFGWSTGWAGLGVDQIVGAKVVNAEGKVIDADERLLRGIRGGGGQLGVIAEVTIKVYPIEEVHTSSLIYATADIKNSVTTFFTNLQALVDKEPVPQKLSLNPAVARLPQVGHMFALSLTWYGKRTLEFDSWLKKLASLAPMAGPSPQEVTKSTTTIEAMDGVTNSLPYGIHSHMQTVALTHWSPQAIAAYAKHVELMVEGTGTAFHEVRAGSPSCGKPEDFPGSVFGIRRPHMMIEILPFAFTPGDADQVNNWAAAFRDELAATDAALEWSYPSLTAPEHLDPEKLWGGNAKELRELKKEFDPTGIFKSLPAV